MKNKGWGQGKIRKRIENKKKIKEIMNQYEIEIWK